MKDKRWTKNSQEVKMAWNKWLKEKRFTLFRSAIIQEQFIQCIMDHTTGGKILETGFGFQISFKKRL